MGWSKILIRALVLTLSGAPKGYCLDSLDLLGNIRLGRKARTSTIGI